MKNNNSLKYYNEIGNWDFGHIKYITEQEIDWDFYKEIKKHTNSRSLVLDLGTGGGEKVLKLMPEVGMVIATDFSLEMIKTANNNLQKYPDKRVKFAYMDNLNMKFIDNLFDAVTARHTMIDAKKIYNCLVKNGTLIIEGVDKRDCWELKKLFKRGQNYNDKKSISKKDYDAIKKAGFTKIELKEVIQYEYYKTEEDLLALLIKTPILGNFLENINLNNEKELDLFNQYVKDHTTKKGIELKRVLYGIVAIK